MRCRGAQGICPLPGPAQRPAGLAAQWQLSCSRPSALRAARNQRRAGGRVQARRIGLAMGDCAHVPARRILPVCYRSTDCTAKHDNCTGALASRSHGKLWPRLRSTNAPWGFLRVHFDPSAPDEMQVRRCDAACRLICQMRELNADICANL